MEKNLQTLSTVYTSEYVKLNIAEMAVVSLAHCYSSYHRPLSLRLQQLRMVIHLFCLALCSCSLAVVTLCALVAVLGMNIVMVNYT